MPPPRAADREQPRLPVPICTAASRGDVDTVLGWLDGGGAIDSCDAADETLLHLASFHGREQLVAP